jgi:HEPN domain-containing protein
MNRKELHQLAKERIRDAKVLLAARRWSGAYYLAGYAVECGLKACIIVQLKNADDFPDKKFSEQCWTHNLVQLVGLAKLKTELGIKVAADPKFSACWETVRDWNELSRYDRKTKTKALQLYAAIANTKHGVFRWIMSHW